MGISSVGVVVPTPEGLDMWCWHNLGVNLFEVQREIVRVVGIMKQAVMGILDLLLAECGLGTW